MLNVQGKCYYCGEEADGSSNLYNNRVVCSESCADNLRRAHTASAHGFQPPTTNVETETGRRTKAQIRAEIEELDSQCIAGRYPPEKGSAYDNRHRLVSEYLDAPEEELCENEETKAVKADAGKPPMALLDPVALREMARVLGHGAEKYAAHNWRKGMEWSRLYSAALRHLLASLEGEDADSETGISHLAHAAVDLMFLLNYQLTGKGVDDRAKE